MTNLVYYRQRELWLTFQFIELCCLVLHNRFICVIRMKYSLKYYDDIDLNVEKCFSSILVFYMYTFLDYNIRIHFIVYLK